MERLRGDISTVFRRKCSISQGCMVGKVILGKKSSVSQEEGHFRECERLGVTGMPCCGEECWEKWLERWAGLESPGHRTAPEGRMTRLGVCLVDYSLWWQGGECVTL